MRIKYFLLADTNVDNGPNKKIRAQIAALKQFGVCIELTKVDINNNRPATERSRKRISYFLFLNNALYIRSFVFKIIESLDTSDILYYRSPSSFFLYHPINYIKKFRICKIVTEHQSIETYEMKILKNYLGLIFDLFFGKIIRRQSDAIVGVTEEITQYQLDRSGEKNTPHITIGNGVDVSSIFVRETPSYTSDILHILFVANISHWHGIDRLFKGLTNYQGNTQITIHIAGEGDELPSLKKMSRDLNISKNVIYYGFISGKPLDELYNNCHIAIGGLGDHRRGLTQSSNLKVREYCAKGIPFILSSFDSDIPNDFPFMLRVPSDESPIDFEQVLSFTKSVFSNLDHPKKMHEYAIENLDWSIKMKKLKNFFEMLK